MIRVVLDWETAYGKHPATGENITLSKMTTEEYVRHPLFKAHGLGVKIDRDNSFYLYKPDDLIKFLRTHPWDKSYVIGHHTQFDGAILSWRCGIRPKFLGCTMSMGRAIFPNEAVSLARLAHITGIGEKGTELQHFAGKWSLTDAEQAVMGGYCCNDIDLTSDLFDYLKKHFPIDELRLIDWTIRAFTEPVIEVDRRPLLEAYKSERRRKRSLITQCVADKTALASNDQFAQVLLSLGIDPPKKVSPSKVKDGRVDPQELDDPPQGILPTFKAPKGATKEQREMLKEEKKFYPWAYAFGKTDEEFKLLQDHPDPKVQAVVEARLGIKSTIKETRTKRFYKIGKRGRFPVYLNYYGAHTNRWSGGDKQNAQNLNRVDDRDPTSGALRMSWVAPRGHVVVVRDLGQIEARKLCYIAGQDDMIDMFRKGGDPYNFMATKIYGFEVDRKHNPAHKNHGQVGKIVVLGSGYQMGAWKLQENVRVGFMGMPGIIFGQDYVDQLGVDVESFKYQKSYLKGFKYAYEQAEACKPLNVSLEDHITHCAVTKHLIDVYRRENPKVVALWKSCLFALDLILANVEGAQVGERGLIFTHPDGLVLPNGMKIRYSHIRKGSKGDFKYLANARKKEWTKIYGGKCCENIVQALSRLIISDQMLRVQNTLSGYSLRGSEVAKVASSTHDEIICVVPERYADECLQMMGDEMKTPPKWCADIPLKSSGGYARSYGECEK